MYQIVCYVPASHLESVKQALFDQGAGHYGLYDCCSWETQGTGQYRPLAASNPYAGTQHQLERVPEYKIELICQPQHLHAAIKAMLQAHPYETPAYHIYPVHTMDSLPIE